MSDVVVTIPKDLWEDWIDEGDLPGDPPSGNRSHFWITGLPAIDVGERVYIVAHGRLRGYAPLVGIEQPCSLWRQRSCLLRDGGAVAVTISEPIRGFQGWRYRWWDRDAEGPFRDWRTAELIGGSRP